MGAAAYSFIREFDPAPTQRLCVGRHYLLAASRGALRLELDGTSWTLPPARAALIAAGVPIEVTIPQATTTSSVLFAPGFVSRPPPELAVFDLTPLARELIAECSQWSDEHASLDRYATAIFQALAETTWALARHPSPAHMPTGRSVEVRRALAITAQRLVDIGVIAALPGEARSLRKSTARWGGSSPEVVLSGIGPQAAGAAAEQLVRSGATGLVSFGYAGALKPALRSGSLVLPDAIVEADGTRHETDGAWLAALMAAIALDVAVVGGTLLTMPRMLTSAEDKHAAHLATGAVAVDMESSAIAAVAERHDLPFIAVRAVLDEAGHTVPSAILAAVDERGTVGLGRLILALLARRREIATLIPLARAARASNQTLRAVCRLGGPRFGLVG